MFETSRLNTLAQRDGEKPLIMLVDDEEPNLTALADLLEDDYEIITSANGLDALSKIEAMDDPAKIQLIISDQRMPKMTGVEFFERIIDRMPDTVRIILTGYTDIKAIIDSINKANIYKFITKPFEPDDFLLTVKRAIETHTMKLRIQESERIKREFISTISHELRTPMHGIQGAIELMKLDTDQRHYRHNLATIEASAHHMMGLIGSILDFTVFEAGKIEVNYQTVDVEEALQKVIDEYAAQARARGLHFHYQPARLANRLSVDIDKLIKVANYILSNAIKFTTEGTISVRVAEIVENDVRFLRLEIEDTGVGIDKVQQSEVFDLFKQADGSFSRRHGGLGIGLTLTKCLLDALEGKIQIYSEREKGSTFVVCIPIRDAEIEADSVPKASAPDSTALASVEGRRVLVVEDNVVNQMVLKSMIEHFGCEVFTCNNGKEAVHWCRAHKADLIFMDCQMPVMDGLEATQKIRMDNHANSVRPIIAVTANVTSKDMEDCIEAGMNGFLSKPVTKEVVGKALKQWLHAFQTS